MTTPSLPIISFETIADLHEWLRVNHATSSGVFIRIYKKKSLVPSVSFEEVLDEGLCFGWSESKRLPYDALSYLQMFTPRKTTGTVSERNRRHVEELIAQGRMTPAGLAVLRL